MVVTAEIYSPHCAQQQGQRETSIIDSPLPFQRNLVNVGLIQGKREPPDLKTEASKREAPASHSRR
jgi:hypothetical protein